MHGAIDIIGPGMYVFFGFFVVVAACGVWMMIDSARAKRRNNKIFHHVPHEPLSVYRLCGGIYTIVFLLMVLLTIIQAKQTSLSMIVLLAAPFMVIIELAYLLRVVYPKPSKLATEQVAAMGEKSEEQNKKHNAGKKKLEEDNFFDQPEEKEPSPKSSKDKS